MPIGWPEPFGLVAIEAMACGTPVIAFPLGSMPELIEPGVNGFLVETVEQAAVAAEAVAGLHRRLCRRTFQERFTAARMAKSYIDVYERLVDEAAWCAGGAVLDTASMAGGAAVAARESGGSAKLGRSRANGSRPV